MKIINYSTARGNLKDYCDQVCETTEPFVVTRKNGKDIVMLSLEEYDELQRRLRNAEYLAKIAAAELEVAQGHVVTKTLADLEALAKA